MKISESVRLEPGVYVLPHGIEVVADGIRIEAADVTLIGQKQDLIGITVRSRQGVAVHGISIRNYFQGIHISNSTGIELIGAVIEGTHEAKPNTEFLNIWQPPEQSPGGAICLIDCEDCRVEGNSFQHQMNGILTFRCVRLSVVGNQCSYNSGWGIHLCETVDSLFEANSCDYCCRFEPREGGPHFGHMGADAAGFLVVKGSSRNKFIGNTARMGGDGFFLAGLLPDGTPCGCNDNLFEGNDASLSPNIGFESTFCECNTFRNNIADRCNYGFWCGYSKDFRIEKNRMLFNGQAGIAVENGVGFHVLDNQFQSNGHGILLWSSYSEDFRVAFPDRDTSREWSIENNSFLSNGKAIRIAADQDHGIRPGKVGAQRPHHHSITNNCIQNNRVGIELVDSDHSKIEGNTIHNNVEANIIIADCEGSRILNNLGSAGGYL
ncbi:MAG: NosD domain-containing protein [Fimbriimonadales bacterium]